MLGGSGSSTVGNIVRPRGHDRRRQLDFGSRSLVFSHYVVPSLPDRLPARSPSRSDDLLRLIRYARENTNAIHLPPLTVRG